MDGLEPGNGGQRIRKARRGGHAGVAQQDRQHGSATGKRALDFYADEIELRAVRGCVRARLDLVEPSRSEGSQEDAAPAQHLLDVADEIGAGGNAVDVDENAVAPEVLLEMVVQPLDEIRAIGAPI
jgi:hypothetical protein